MFIGVGLKHFDYSNLSCFNEINTYTELSSKRTIGLKVMVFDFHNLNTYCLGPVFEGTVFSSTPSLIDINNDDIFEFVFAHSNSFMSNNVFSEVTLLELEWKNLKPTYPCFLGQEGNGVIQK